MNLCFRLVSVIYVTSCLCLRVSGLTPDNPYSGFTFALLTDLHISPGTPNDSSLYRIVDEINHSAFDFTVVTGDISNTGSDAEIHAVKRALDKLRKQYYILPGNHETNWSESAGLTMVKLWGSDRFAFSHKGYRLAGFNTGPFMKMGDGHVKQEDLKWLQKQVSEKPADEKLIAFAHYPLSEGLDNWPDVTAILKQAGCRVVFCGHGHSLKLFNFDGIPGVMCRSLILGKSPVAGYNIITLRNDSVLVYNKTVNGKSTKPEIGFSLSNSDAISGLPVSPLPDFSVNNEFTNYEICASWTDSASIFSGPCLFQDSVLVYGNSLGYINALNTRTKKLVWQKKIAGPVFSTPVTDNKNVVLGTVDGKIICLNGSNGSLVWEVKTGRPVLAEGIVDKGAIYIGGGDSIFYSINIKTGKINWKFSGLSGLVQGKPALSESAVVFGAWDRYLYCLDRKTGSLRWKWDNGKPQVLYSPGNVYPVCSGNTVFIVAPDRFMTAIDLSTGMEIWRTARHHVRESMGASPDGSVIYAKLMNDTIIAVPAHENTFRTLWKANAGFGYEHSPCPVFSDSKMVIASTRDGLLVAIDPVTSAVLWKYKAGNSAVNKMVSDGKGMLWFTLMEGKLTGLKTYK